MSTPSGQLLPAKDLKRIQNLRSQHTKSKASKEEMTQYNKMKEEILQFMLLKKKKIQTTTKNKVFTSTRFFSQTASNDSYITPKYSQKQTYLVD